MNTVNRSLRVVISDDEREAGRAAGRAAAVAIAGAIARGRRARVIFASAPSQAEMLAELVRADVDWTCVDAFHMDEYIGIDPQDPRSFARWLQDRLPVDRMGSFTAIDSLADPREESRRYDAMLRERAIDLTLMGFGMNGHIAFNEPGTDLCDSAFVRPVTLTMESRQQQVVDGLFADVDETPTHAVSLTVPALMSAHHVVSTVIGEHKAQAVRRALEGQLTPQCPASVIRFHRDAQLHLDATAAGALSRCEPGPWA